MRLYCADACILPRRWDPLWSLSFVYLLCWGGGVSVSVVYSDLIFFNTVYACGVCTDYLPSEMHPASIKRHFEAELVPRLPTSRFAIVVDTKVGGLSTKHAVCSYVNEHHFDLLVMGMVGRKGPKDSTSLLGSVADYSMREVSARVLVCVYFKAGERCQCLECVCVRACIYVCACVRVCVCVGGGGLAPAGRDEPTCRRTARL